MSLKRIVCLAVLGLAVLPQMAAADDCRAPGNLIFLGTTANQARSVWLSASGAGPFDLKTEQNNQSVDQFNKARRGLHVSLSPVVANGAGGAHTLFGSGGCTIGTATPQLGGVDFSRRIHLLNGEAQRLPPGLLGRIQSRLPESFRKKSEPEPVARDSRSAAMADDHDDHDGDGGDHGDGDGHGGEGGEDGGNSGSGNNGNGGGTNCGNCNGNNGNGNGNGGNNGGGTVTPPEVTPITPEVPVAPVAPLAPVAPTPVTPITPEVPVAPVAPLAPVAPAPVTPITPEVPVAPVAPLAPVAPTPVTPTVPVVPVAPLQPLPPTPVRPITPTVPVVPTPPIGTLPPTTGVTPGMPGGVAPPIGTLPPGTGTVPVTPTVPTVPTLPGAVTPPIGTLPPPSGRPELPGATPSRPTVPGVDVPARPITPELPGGVTPPVGTLPPPSGRPELPGVTPSRPTVPGIDVPARPITPELPGGVTPPIGTLPPTTGVTPGVPGVITPPIDPSGPPVGPTPTRPIVPGVVTPPIGVLPPEPPTPGRPPVEPVTPTRPGVDPANPGVRPVAAPAAPATVLPCPDPDPAHRDPRRPIDCPDPQQLAMAADSAAAQEIGQRPFGGQAPITPGRQFRDEPRWDIWIATGPYGDSFDTRYDLDLRSRSEFVNVGVDRLFGDNVVFGVNANFERNRTDGFTDTWRVATTGFTVGPHLGYRFSDSWTLDGSVGAGWFDNTTQLDVLSGDYTSQRYTGALNLTGQYSAGHTNFRPKLGASYNRAPSQAYTLNGTTADGGVSVGLDASLAEYGDASAAIEITHGFGRGGTLVVPYVEMGARYEYLRANGGQMLTGDLTMATPSPWSGTVHAGVRTLISGSTFLELGGGYLSLGQRRLATWETRVSLSQGF